MPNARATTRLIEVLADLREHAKATAHLDLTVNLIAAQKQRRLDQRLRDAAGLAGYHMEDLCDLDDQVRNEVHKRRDAQRRVRAHSYDDAFASMMDAAGIKF
jgi:dihydroorotase-like cyclic amidohydrolase